MKTVTSKATTCSVLTSNTAVGKEKAALINMFFPK